MFLVVTADSPADLRTVRSWVGGLLRPGCVAAGVWLAVIVAAAWWGATLPAARLHLGNAPPLFGYRRAHLLGIGRLWPALLVAVPILLGLPVVAQRARFGTAVVLAWTAAAGWAVALAASEGVTRIGSTLTTRYEYLSGVAAVGDAPLSYLRHFTARLPSYPTHVKGHGPLAILFFWALGRIGLGGPTAVGLIVVLAGSSSVVAVAMTVRALISEQAARACLPLIATLPAAVWVATSADAVFLGASAWAVAALAFATTRTGWSARTLALGSGVLMGIVAYMSYGLLVLAGLPVAVLLAQRRLRLLIWAVAGVAAVGAALTLVGFWYLDGLAATHRAWAAGVGPARSRSYFLLADLADLALIVGPATAWALSVIRDRKVLLIVAAAALAVAASDASGFVRGEAERIWLPFAPWLAVAASDLRIEPRRTSVMLAPQLGLALILQAAVHSPW